MPDFINKIIQNENGELYMLGLAILVSLVSIYLYMNRSESFDDTSNIDVPNSVSMPATAMPAPIVDTIMANKIQSQFVDEDNPIACYTTYLQKTGQFNPHSGGNFFMENEENNLYKKQGVISADDAAKQKAYTDGQFGRWGLAQLSANDNRYVTSPFVGTTRSLSKAVKIRAGATIVPDRVSGLVSKIQ